MKLNKERARAGPFFSFCGYFDSSETKSAEEITVRH